MRRLALLAPAAVILLAPGGAHAATFYVEKTGSGTACSQAAPCLTIAQAISTARAAPSPPHTIEIGPGTYPEGVQPIDELDSGLDINGSGSGADPATATIVMPPAGGYGVNLGGLSGTPTGMSLRGIRLVNPGRGGINSNSLDTVIEDVHIELGTTVLDGIHGGNIPSLSVARAVIRLGGPGATGIYSQGTGATGVELTVRDSDIRGAGSSGIEQRAGSTDELVIERTIVRTAPDADSGVRGEGIVTASSSLIGGGVVGVVGSGIGSSLRGTTVDRGLPGVADAQFDDGEGPAGFAVAGQVETIDSSILLEGIRANSGTTTTCTNSNVPNQVAAATVDGGAINCPSSAARPQGNFQTAPAALFENGPLGDWRLRAGSPAVDAGGPGLVGNESQLDLAGGARIIDGDANGVVRRDQGAYEAPTRVPAIAVRPDTTLPVIRGARFSPGTFAVARASTPKSARRAKRGTTLRVRLSERATVRIEIQKAAKGRRVKGKCRKPTAKRRKARRCTRYVKVKGAVLTRKNLAAGLRKIKFSGRIGRKALKPGRYRALISATDAAGNKSKVTRARFRIVRLKRR